MDVLVGTENRIDTSVFTHTQWVDAPPGQLLEQLNLHIEGNVQYDELFQNRKQDAEYKPDTVDFVWAKSGDVVAFYDNDLGMLYY